MKSRMITLILIVLIAVYPTLATSSLTKEERANAVSLLKDTQKELMKTVNGLSEKQLNFKPDADTWSIAEVLEHIALSELGLSQAFQMTLKAESEDKPENGVSDEMIVDIITNREQKVKTRPDLEPINKFGSASGSIEAFENQRKTNIDFIKETEDSLRDRYFEFPFGKADAYQLMLFIAGHSQRHTDQIKEVMANTNFPS
ncbi:MAG: DinB family protein [Cyclobacteriaceae bacterium]